ncbi:MAG: O-antigen/teichoic acid export membrane protein [Planctomycetota bacterium]|jgi:O-antigen/teichoic acid export membrane protein
MSASEEEQEQGGSNKLSGLLKHSAIYSAAPFLRQFISMGMTPLYNSWLQTARGGIKETADLWLIGLQQLLGQNALGSMMRFYYEQKSERDRNSVVTSCTIAVTLIAWVVCGSAMFFAPDLVRPLFGSGNEVGGDELVRVVQLVLLLIPFQLSTMSGMYYLMTLKRSRTYTIIQTAKLLLEIGLNIWLIRYRGLGVQGFLTSMLCGEIVTSLGLTGWMLITLKPRFDRRVFRPILVYAAPLIPVGICQLILHQVDRRLIIEFLPEAISQSNAGIYGFGYKIGYLVTAMILGPFVQIFQPWIFNLKDPKERGRQVARVSTYAVLAIGAATLGVQLFGRQATILLSGDETFIPAYRVVPLIAAGYVFWALYHVSQMPLFLAKRTGRLFGINLAAVVINISLNAFLIPRMGIMGAATATCVTFAALACMGMLASRSEADVPFETVRLVKVLALVLAGAGLALWLDDLEHADTLALIPALAIKACVLLVLLGSLWKMVLRSDERAELTTWIASRHKHKSD